MARPPGGSLYAPAFARILLPTLPAQKAGLAPLGAVRSCEYVDGTTANGMRVARYRVGFAKLPLYATLHVDAEGRIASFRMEGATAIGP